MRQWFQNLFVAALLAGTFYCPSASAANETGPLLTQENLPASEALDPTSLNCLQADPLSRSADAAVKGKTVIHFLTGIDMTRLERAEDEKNPFEGVAHPVSVLVFEKSTKAGDEANGSYEYLLRYSSGFETSVKNVHATEADIRTSRTTLSETNRDKTWEGKREVDYSARLEDGKIISETYDVLYTIGNGEGNEGHVLTREILRYAYRYDESGKKLQSMAWTKYKDELNTAPHKIDLHAVLVYDEHGQPDQGYADKWDEGRKNLNLFAWKSEKSMLSFTTKELWSMWEKWIKNGPAHIFLV